MSTTYGTASSITIPSDGDTIDAADVNTPLAALWDQHDTLADLTALTAILVPTHGLMRHVRGYGHYVFVTSGTYSASTAASPWILSAGDGTAGRWVLDLTSQAQATVIRSFSCADGLPRGSVAMAKTHDITATGFWYPCTGDSTATDAARSWMYSQYRYMKFPDAENASAVGRHLLFPLNQYLLQGSTLVSATLNLAGTGHANLPAMMPSLAIVRYKPEDNSLASLLAANTMDDASPNVAAYDAVHSITLACDQNTTVDMEANSYYAVVCNEGHTNSLAELRLYNLILKMTAKGFF